MFNFPVIKALLLVCSAVTSLGKQLCLVGDFESQVQYIRDNVMLSPAQIANLSQVFDDVRDTLLRRWGDVEVFPYGSLTTGVALTYSDGDCYAKVPNYNWTTDEPVLYELFQLQPDLYSRLYIYPAADGGNYTQLTVFHKPNGRFCDVIFNNVRGFQSSRVLDYVIRLNEKVAPLVGIIKLWSKIHQITGHGLLSSFGVYTLVIFYLQQKKMAPPIFTLQKDLKSPVYDQWDMSFREIPYNSTNEDNLYQLLGGFFKYYSDFNFKDYIVSPFVGRPVQKSEFADITKIPDEFDLYKTYIVKKGAVPLNLNTDFCIQEVFQHNNNAAEKVGGQNTLKIISHIKFAARMFEQLPSERLLRAILKKDQHNEPFERRNEISVDEIIDLKDCMNGTVTSNK